MRGLLAALGLFTIIPAPVLTTVDRDVARRAIAAFPWLGALLGLAAGAVGAGVGWRSGSGFLAGIVVLLVLVGATGAMHLDGIADTADGLGSRKGPDEALAIMKRSDIGPMGVTALVGDLLLGAALLSSLPWRWLVVAAVLGPMVGRLGVVQATLVGTPCARPGGFGSLFSEVTSRATFAAEVATALVVAGGAGFLAGGGWGVAATCAALLAALGAMAGWAQHLRRRLGGLTGDCFGSLIEVGQLVCWLVLALAR